MGTSHVGSLMPNEIIATNQGTDGMASKHSTLPISSGLTPHALNDHTDVSVPSPTTGHALTWDGSAWVDSAVASALNDLTDVNVPTPVANDLLSYDGSSWVNKTPAAVAATMNLDDLGDVVVPSPNVNDVLKWDGSNWVNGPISSTSMALNDLTDVNAPTPSANDLLSFDGTNWINKTPAAVAATMNLGDLGDVTITSPTANQVLTWDGSKWVNQATPTSSHALNDHTDVNAPTPSTGDFLKYDGANWINSIINLNDLNDVNASSPSTGDHLVWSGSAWVAQTPGSGGHDIVKSTNYDSFVEAASYSGIAGSPVLIWSKAMDSDYIYHVDARVILLYSASGPGNLDGVVYRVRSSFYSDPTNSNPTLRYVELPGGDVTYYNDGDGSYPTATVTLSLNSSTIELYVTAGGGNQIRCAAFIFVYRVKWF